MENGYTIDSTWGGKITLGFNNNRSKAEAHDVILTTESSGDRDNAVVYSSVKGQKNIREFLYNFAFFGGLIKEGEVLVIHEPSGTEIPADGLYKLTGASKDRPFALVQGGQVLVPQPDEGTLLDFTDTYLSKFSGWELTPLVRKSRSDG